ncbi:inorganic phosphate transporter [Candidatus Nanohalococcus occultus]|uniref:Phosphate transporter n=1 Tax=Candidatus Nanohalococcus occultus TaxID=2978047 RepID=A0ABY8CED8_9ARCH|nr:Phosphate/sulfate permease [Candidatus Nanohaloarchaeota archaeon SVXNc]
MSEILIGLGILAAVFVGINIGGSSTGVAFGPSVGSKLVSKHGAAALMTVFALIGGWTLGRKVIETMGGQIVPASQFSLTASVLILFFIGLSLLISNLSGVPASTSMTAVGSIAGLGIATGTLRWEVMGKILSWWLVAPAVAFLVGGLIGRYLYVHLDRKFSIDQSDGKLLELSLSKRPIRLGEGTSIKELFSSTLVLSIACYMAFSAGASNVANAVAPLIGSPAANMNVETGVIIAIGAMSVGGFTIARKTLDTVGEGITDMPLLAALIVSTVSASIITVLSLMGIPASLAISATMCITGLGWGRASRTVKVKDAVKGEKPKMKTAALKADEGKKIGEESKSDIPDKKLFDPDTISQVVTMWILTPIIAAVCSYGVFTFTAVF